MPRRHIGGGTLLSPLPAVLVTCGSKEKCSVLTIAWTGIISTRPPKLYISVRPERNSYGIIKETGEFAVNLTTSKMVREVDLCGVKSGREVDKIALCGFHTEPAERIDCPVLSESPLSLECKVSDIMQLGSHDMFIADILAASADERYLDSKGKLNLQQSGLLAYSHGEYFSLGRKLGSFGFSVRKKAAEKRKRADAERRNANAGGKQG